LDHLLARFGQQSHYSEVLASQPVDGVDGQSALSRQISSKRSLLADYVRTGNDRGLGFNYLKELGPDNMSGLERALRHTFGLGLEQHDEQFLLVEHILLRPIASDQQEVAKPFLCNARSSDPYSLQLTLVFPDCKRYEPRPLVETIVRDETPAHLRLHFLWKDKSEMQTFTAARNDWLKKWRTYRMAEFANQLPSEDQDIALRNARNQLINLLEIGTAPTDL